jgi:putative sporulation protein YyaC
MTRKMDTFPPTPLYRESYQSNKLVYSLSHHLYSTLLPKMDFYDIVFVCIGTDRSTGDALGPLVGSKLEKLYPENLTVYGTLDDPVHAINLEEKLEHISKVHRTPYIIAIDACLGESKSVGMITLAQGSLKPGAGVQKKLPEVGNLHLTGIVNVGGFMEYFVLQNTRLSIVMNMADKIASAIYYCSIQLKRRKGTLSQQSQREIPL